MDMFSMPNNMTTSDAASFMDCQTFGWTLCMIVGLPENSYVIWLIVTGAGNGVASEFFSLNLSICEFFTSLQALFCLMCRAFPNLWLVVLFMSGIPVTGRPLFQCLICVDCYLAVVHPVIFLKFKPLRYRMICCAAAWIMILCSCVFANFTAFQIHMYSFMCYYLINSLMTFSIMLFCCLAVLRALKQSGPGEKRKEKKNENQMKRRAFTNIVKIIMGMLLIYASYLLSGISYLLKHEIILSFWTAGQICFVLGCLVQPLLFLQRTGKFPFCKDS